ncbi:hypothetical protein ABZU76_12725 [Amycolatopsis sp. NPDC005232]|uniref:hypothetical protein n=1 Tax=Amycolatopsis sp. NPDC005232 TaxID=3157027 RepID=UPI0033AE98A4
MTEGIEPARRRLYLAGSVVVFAGLVFQISYGVAGTTPGSIPLLVAAALVVLTATAAMRARRAAAVAGWVAAVLLAADFGGAVADRFGLLGAPGESGVTWGSWTAFTAYTGQLVPWLPAPLVDAAAVGATVAEIVVCVWLLSGWRRREAGVAAAVVLAAFSAAMVTTVGPAAVAKNAVFLLLGGALVLATVPAYGGFRVRSAAPAR